MSTIDIARELVLAPVYPRGTLLSSTGSLSISL